MLASRRHYRSTIDVWPGYVDALSALLMLVIFALLIFTLAQAFLGQTLSEREQELSDLNSRLRELSSLLDLEQEKNLQLNVKVKEISDEYSQSLEQQYELFGEVERLNQTVATDKETIELQLRTLASLQQDVTALRELRAQLEQEVGRLSVSLQGREAEVGLLRDRSKSLQARLADESERTLLAQQTIEQKDIRIQDLFTLVETGQEALQQEKQLSTSARAQVELLNRQISALREQLGVISEALKLTEQKRQGQELEIADLGRRLNLALAKQVNELEKYRSEFFGTLRSVLGKNPDVRVVGDRFVFPSELLFDSGSATLGRAGEVELSKLAQTLTSIAAKIPPELSWILRVDGHTDRQPINTEKFPSNWELSTARAVSVVRHLVSQGISPKRLAATGFGEYHPVDQAESVEAYRRNRRIEIKLTDK
ncbi:MAG: peptidoglycan -binding protein [Gammaproteobacteria bacterium]|nr:peptidoglycan -binding protein [Gammaproteobacteria bacterium]MCB1852488.1 peptidoglycan -binding protein [Gammaproteobacteria bacterium]